MDMAGANRTNGSLGRPPFGSENEATKMRREMQNRWLRKVNASADEIFQAHLDLALGCCVEEVTPQGNRRVYSRPPNGQCLQWLMENVWGKPVQPIELQEKAEMPMLTDEEFERIEKDLEKAFADQNQSTSNKALLPVG